MRRLILWFVTRYIRSHMSHCHAAERDAIFRAIGEGIKESFYEDNFNTRLQFTVTELTYNMPEALTGYYHMGHILYHDAYSAGKCADAGVREAMRNVPIPEWRRKELEAQKSA
jgi:hypothetical protein